MKRIPHKRRLRKSVREFLTVVLVGTIGAVLLVGMWIGSVVQTSERLSEAVMEVAE